MCPQCGREAPLVYRGPLAFCSACNAPRAPLSSTGVNLTGKPARLGGTLATVLGWTVLAIMLAMALVIGVVLHALSPAIGFVVGGVIAALGVAAAMVLLMGGKLLHRTGDRAAFTAKRDAVFALAQNQRGILRPDLAARSLGVSTSEADAFLTSLSRQPESGVILEVDNDGKLYYRFSEFAPDQPWPPLGSPPAPAAPPPEPARVRVAKTELVNPPPGGPGANAADELLEDEGPSGTKRARTLPE
jgi:hypothetical protein